MGRTVLAAAEQLEFGAHLIGEAFPQRRVVVRAVCDGRGDVAVDELELVGDERG